MTFNFIDMVTVFVHKFTWIINSSVFITMCLSLEYAFQQSETITVPGSIHFWMMGSSVCSSRFSTATKKHFLPSSSIPPKTQWPSTWWPQRYFLLPNSLSSVCTTFPFARSFSLFLVEWSRKLRDRSCPSPPVLSASPSLCFGWMDGWMTFI